MKASPATSISRRVPRPKREKRINHLTPAMAMEQGKGYVVLPSDAVSSLDPFSYKLLAVLLNRSSDFQWNRGYLRRAAKISDYRVRDALLALKATGYVKTEHRTTDGGTKMAGQKWWVTAIPFVFAKTADSEAVPRVVEIRQDGEHHDKCIVYHNVTTPLPSPCRRGDQESFPPGEELETMPEAADPVGSLPVSNDQDSLTVLPGDPDNGMGDQTEDILCDISPVISDSVDLDNVDTELDAAPADSDISPVISHSLPESLRPSRNWGDDTRAAFQWVLNSQFAEEFRKILGNGFAWDMASARMFYRRFRAGTIRPVDIYTMQGMGLSQIREVCAVAATSLTMLCRRWESIINRFAADENKMWQYHHDLVMRTMSRVHGTGLWEEVGTHQAEGTDLPVEPNVFMLHAFDGADPEWTYRQLERWLDNDPARLAATLSCVCPVQAVVLLDPACSPPEVIRMARGIVLPDLIKLCALSETVDRNIFQSLAEVVQQVELL